MRYFHTLTFRVLVGSCVLLVLLFWLYTYFAVRLHTAHMMEQVIDSANRVADVIKQSTHYSMLQGRNQDSYEIMQTIGQEPGVEGIRTYDKHGRILFSTDKSQEGQTVDMHSEACAACHSSSKPLEALPAGDLGHYYASAGYRVVQFINPIRNEQACSNAPCHAHDSAQTVLGVLDVRMSLKRVDDDIARDRQKLVLYAIGATIIVTLITGVFLSVTVHRPVQRLREGTRQVSTGNLDYRIRISSKDEIGELSHAFNEMTQSLQKAELEKRLWSETLERRVTEKTAELNQIHEQILQIEKMASLGKLSATVAHELNNPLEGILNYCKLIARRLDKVELTPAMQSTKEDLQAIISEVRRCGNIVKNLLLFSRRQVGEFALVPAAGIIDKAVWLMQHHFKISNVNFQSEIAVPEAKLMCDESQIEQALVALFVNAVEAMPKGGDLRLTLTGDPSGSIRIEIADTGVGIAAEDMPHLFEPFFTTKKEGKGVGLGLSVVYGIIERHGGALSVRSEPGEGTVFTLSFPSAEKSLSPAQGTHS